MIEVDQMSSMYGVREEDLTDSLSLCGGPNNKPRRYCLARTSKVQNDRSPANFCVPGSGVVQVMDRRV
jgi:hypothetical protein